MREIKFRAWDKKKREMRPVGIYNGKAFPNYEPGESTNCPLCCPDWDDIDRGNLSEPMQSTGRQDKSGNEIYDGDIIKWSKDKAVILAKVQWLCDGFEPFNNIEDPRTGRGVFNHYPEYIEVVGNIHENPELLEKKI